MTGADFKYLLATAQVESRLNPNAQAPSSSARGLSQFIEQTWLSTLKEQGGALGYAPYASAISRQPRCAGAVSRPGLIAR
jgi:soluble lytic murein transglycosylase-like protein